VKIAYNDFGGYSIPLAVVRIAPAQAIFNTELWEPGLSPSYLAPGDKRVGNRSHDIGKIMPQLHDVSPRDTCG
jgi:hypothetical protein